MRYATLLVVANEGQGITIPDGCILENRKTLYSIIVYVLTTLRPSIRQSYNDRKSLNMSQVTINEPF
jgi:hypothetical protein